MINDFRINDLPFPQSQELKEVIEFFCHSIGVNKDINIKVLTILFIESKYGKGILPEEVADKLDMKVKDARNILDKFMTIGIARRSRERYIFREASMSMTLDAILDDIFLISRNLKRACVIIDRKGTKNAVNKLLKEWK
jgi:hypothetical protein